MIHHAALAPGRQPRTIIRHRALLLGAFVLLMAAGAVALDDPAVTPPTPGAQAPVDEVAAPPVDGFKRATPGYVWDFPRDHGSHPDYRTEWWYYTGHLEVEGLDRPFGFHLTFFRLGIDQFERRRTGRQADSAFALEHLFWSHFALSDVRHQRFYQSEMLNRGFPSVAEASSEGLDLRNGTWTIREESPNGAHLLESSMRDEDTGKRWTMSLRLEPQTPPLFHGLDGFSQKGPKPGQASMYYSLPRMRVTGTLTEEGRAMVVRGQAWMDHEFMTNLLDETQVGWDWFSIQLDDGSHLMAYHIRLEDGGVEPLSKGTFLDADGTVVPLTLLDYTITVLDRWTSPHTGAVYPSGWRIEVPRLGLNLRLEPRLRDQEMRPRRGAATTYYEGACTVEGTRDGLPVAGRGFAELVGYARRFDESL